MTRTAGRGSRRSVPAGATGATTGAADPQAAPVHLRERARASATRAADGAGVEILEVDAMPDLVRVRDVFDRVWSSRPEEPVVTAELLRAFAHTGQYVVLAFDIRQAARPLIAASVGFLGTPIGRALHSHATGVLPQGRGRALGFAVKLHQRSWALERGLDQVTWTFDPLVRRNAWFNIVKLGARPVHYLVDFYGATDDGINGGDETDRLYLAWDLRVPSVVAASEGRTARVPLSPLFEAGVPVLLSVGADEAPVRSTVPLPPRADLALVQVPVDIEALRRENPPLARRWRLALREVLTAALGGGHRIVGMGRDGWYVLRREAAP